MDQPPAVAFAAFADEWPKIIETEIGAFPPSPEMASLSLESLAALVVKEGGLVDESNLITIRC